MRVVAVNTNQIIHIYRYMTRETYLQKIIVKIYFYHFGFHKTNIKF